MLPTNPRRPGPGKGLPSRALPNRPVRPSAKPAATPAAAPAPSPPGAPAAGSSNPRTPAPAPRKRPRVVRASSSGTGDAGYYFIRIGIFLFLALVGAGVRSATRAPAGDQAYFDQVATFTRSMDKQIFQSRDSFKRQIEALPISGVTDPKLRELHQLLLELLNMPENVTGQQLEYRIKRFDQLVDELNTRYARR